MQDYLIRIVGFNRDRKIQAIKGARAVATVMGFNLGLKDAKNAVERLESGHVLTLECHQPQLLIAVKALLKEHEFTLAGSEPVEQNLLAFATRTHYVDYTDVAPYTEPDFSDYEGDRDDVPF